VADWFDCAGFWMRSGISIVGGRSFEEAAAEEPWEDRFKGQAASGEVQCADETKG